MSGVLEEILASKRAEVHRLRHRTCYARIAEGPRGHVLETLTRPGGAPLRLIAEHKKKSPSAGMLSQALDPAARALAYAESGAAMISVLCDEPFFGGSWDDLVEIRTALDAVGRKVPLLAKEFVIDDRQLREASACGADAVLLIVRIVTQPQLVHLAEHARSLGLEPLVEVASEDELSRALDAKASLIGVNARDLDTLEMDAARAARVLAAMPPSCVPLYLSGLRAPEDVTRVARTRAHGALVGETLMREDDPRPLLAAMVRAAAPGAAGS